MMKDLVLLVADKNMHFALKGALDRPKALGIRPIEFEFRVHPERDGGVRKTGPAMLKLEKRRFSHVLLILDFEGSGTDHVSAESLEADLDTQLERSWQANAKTIVIEPELDIWLWGSDNAISEVINWPRRQPIRSWLVNNGFSLHNNQKPVRPKEALEFLLRMLGLARSSSLYMQIAARISLQRCQDAAFLRLRKQLRTWFGSME